MNMLSQNVDLQQRRAALVVAPPIEHAIAQRTSLADALAHAARVRGDGRLTCIDSSGRERHWTYRTLYEAASRAAAGLIRQGVTPGSHVVLRLADPYEWVLALWACFLARAVAIPTYALEPLPADASGGQRLAGALQVLAPTALLVSTAEQTRATALKDEHGWPQLLVLTPDALLAEDGADGVSTAVASQATPPDPDRLAVIFPTSGSSGTPKPATQTESALLGMCAGSAQMNAFNERDVFMNWMPMDHVGAVVFLCVLPVCVAADQVLVAYPYVRADLFRWLDLMARWRTSVGWVPNHVFNQVAKRLEHEAPRAWDLSALRFLVNAGESISPGFVRQFAEQLQGCGLRADAVRPAFGMSETCSGITWAQGLQVAGDRFVDLGAPIPGAAMRVVGPDNEVLAEGEVGRLHLRGPSVTRSYFRLVRDDVFLPDGWFDTGDSAFIRDGHLYLTDREGDAVAGLPIHGYELEEAIERLEGVLGGHTAVCDGKGEEGPVVVVFYCADPDHPNPELTAHIDATLRRLAPETPIIATAVAPHQLPRTSIGKIQRKVLRRQVERVAQQAAQRRT
ncbi:AMP-binding protein [Roseateles sp. SL47]|uniref:AMP-binding protein n=1 Tax=Roseateles sp. SL47 TaxID=2995138 RepID=UPI00226DB9C0|nr:AMP-binding protein [Roseateles sp. SL47]WAC73078.1 AMP-binding protein [Roseateles sp. SL47]